MSNRPKRSKPTFDDNDDDERFPFGPSLRASGSGPSALPSKRARLSRPAARAANDSASDDSGEEFDHEESLETPRKRKGGVNVDGYESDAQSSAEDSGDDDDDDDDDDNDDGKKKKRREKEEKEEEKEEEEEDDMFAEELPKSKRSVGEKKSRYLTSDDIEGQEFGEPDPSDMLDSDGEPKLEPFHMRAEMEEGDFDAAGSYVRRKRDPNAFHDVWMTGLSRRDIAHAAEARERRERAERLALAEKEADGGPRTREEIWREIIEIVKPGETVLEALQRLAAESGTGKKGAAGAKKMGNWRARQAAAKAKAMEMDVDREGDRDADADGDRDGGGDLDGKGKGKGKEKSKEKSMKEETTEEALRKREIERLTELSDRMMALGYFNVYDDTYELMLRQLRKTGVVAEDWVPASARMEKEKEAETAAEQRWQETRPNSQLAAANTSVDAGPQWEYRWAGTGENAEVYGPFDGAQMKDWSEQGFFEAGIDVRMAGGEAWGPGSEAEYVAR
ncbi:hypothetical protein BC937DRAFT_90330 [Endogone sp. FLAS-F59071]|nr:hypothetical protein BC937DRAFT_90330 [Endogone sp. FLAS-F59071]|eukprot:RUS17156.1 hypothetical protein BC937DRAFT_90330 [Endogone sp. FLAS-F59071]